MAGDIGLGRATELAGFASLLGKLPKFEEVVKKPDTAKMPESVESRYAMVSMLAVRVKKDTMEPVWTYMNRFEEPTMKVVFLKMAMKASPEIKQSKTYEELFLKDKELVKAVASV